MARQVVGELSTEYGYTPKTLANAFKKNYGAEVREGGGNINKFVE